METQAPGYEGLNEVGGAMRWGGVAAMRWGEGGPMRWGGRR